MAKRSKNYQKAKEKVEDKEYLVEEALSILKEINTAKFDESVDLAIRLGVDPKYPDQMVRGTVVLSHGTGKVKKVLVIAAHTRYDEKCREIRESIGTERFNAQPEIRNSNI